MIKPQDINILVGCEESQAVCISFRERGFNAFSNDIIDCSGGHPEWHLKMDIFKAIKLKKWDLIILHPPCTCICVSGNRTYAKGKEKYSERLRAVEWTEDLWILSTNNCKYIALENPVGCLNSLNNILPYPNYIQPWQFGHTEQKKTGLWLHNLPQLKETDNVYNKMMKLHIKHRQKTWWTPPGKNRAEIRSKTYQGIAKAMAEQWGDYLLKELNL